MRRRGGRSCAGCSKSILLAVASILVPASVTADFMDAMPAFVSRPIYAGIPRCAPHEELCPVSSGSNDLHCVDLTDPKTCGGCVTDGEGLDCTSVPDVFMQQCTSRGQCTGCRWKHGGMNASLEEPDFLSCSITLTQPVQASRHKTRRIPQLTFAKQLIKEKLAHLGPMAARRPQNNYAADKAVAKHPPHAFDAAPAGQGYPGIGPGVKQVPAPNALERQRGQAALQPGGGGGRLHPLMDQPFVQAPRNPGSDFVAQKASKRDSFPVFDLQDIPEPPHWLTAYTTSQLSTLPLTDSDDAILGWFQSIETGIVKLGVRFHAMSPQEQKKKISNADRFRLKLPPVPPKALVRPNKPAPFILPGMDYTEEEIEALGLQNYVKTKSEPEQDPEETVTIHDSPSVFWGRLMKHAFASTPKTVRKDVMDALWFLLDTVSRPMAPKERIAPPNGQRQQNAARPNVQQPLQLGTDERVKAAVKPVQQNAFLRPGQLAAGKAARPDSNVLRGDTVGGVQPRKAMGGSWGQKPIPLMPKGKPDNHAAQDDAKRRAAPVNPVVKGRQMQALPHPVGKVGGFGPQGPDVVPQLSEDIGLAFPDPRKPRPANHNAGEAQQPIGNDDDSDDPYARERRRPAQNAAARVEDQEANTKLNEDKVSASSDPVDVRDEDITQRSVEDDEARLLELLVLKQQELAELQRKLLSEHNRKKPARDDSVTGPLVKPLKETVPKQLKASKPESKNQAAKKAFWKNAKEVTPLMPLIPQQNANPNSPTKERKTEPLKPAARRSRDEESADVFEQHLRKAQKAKVKKLEEQVQPEKLLEHLEREDLAEGGENILGRVKKKPMMAGMAKARPDAHLKPDSRLGQGLRQRE